MTSFKIPDGVLTQHIAVLGKTRSGKSSKMRVLVERLLREQKPVTIIDPKGDWWGLKSSADGKREGFPVVILGGEHGDIQINAHSGAAIAELVATGNRPSLIDLGGWRVGERTRFFIDFSETFFKLTKGLRYLVIDEVHNFAPKGKIFSPEAGEMLHWANRLASEGQGKGVVLLAASQRPQKVHNDFLTSCETLIACRVIHKADRDAVKDWIDGCADPELGKQVLRELAGMKRPEAWVWSPEIDFGPVRMEWPMFETFDSFKPQAAGAAKLKGWADVDLDEVKVKLAKVVEEAKANDPSALKRQIAELQRQIKATPAAAPAPAVKPIDTAEYYQSGYNDGRMRGWKDCADLARPYLTGLVDHNEQFLDKVEHIVQLVMATPKFGDAPALRDIPPLRELARRQAEVPHKSSNSRVNARRLSPAKVPHNGDARLNRPQQIILDQLAVLKDRDIYPASRATLAAFCKVSPSSSGYEKNLSTLKTMGMLDYPQQGVVALTREGEACAAAPFDDGTPPADFWLAIVNEPKQKILRVLIDEHPTAMSRGAIAQKASVSENSSGFEKNLSQLKTLGAIDYPMSGVVALTRHVMPA